MQDPHLEIEALARRIGARLRYRSLEHLLGQQITIHSTATVGEDIRGALQPEAASWKLAGPEEWQLDGLLATYGSLDLEFLAGAKLLESGYESGVPLLETLGFVTAAPTGESDSSEAGDESADDLASLRRLEEDLAKDQTLVRIYLQSTKPIEPGFFVKPPAGYLPADFLIEDACVTNAGFVWFRKHFYL